MTDLALQEALMQEIRGMLKSRSLKKPASGEWMDFHLYRQDKPYKDDINDADQEDYIIVMLDDEDVPADGDGQWVVTVHILISIALYEEENQGNVVLANLMNQIYNYFKKKHIIGGRFTMEREAHKRFNHECYPNYYECDLITKWKLPEIQPEWPRDEWLQEKLERRDGCFETGCVHRPDDAGNCKEKPDVLL